MTPRGTQRVSIPRSKYRDYVNVAENFSAGGEVAKTFEYWNAAGVLLIHAAIVYTDALTIKVGGVKSQGEIYTKEDIEKLWKHLERYKAWIVPQLSQ
ncbi:MAG: hypothetical protein HYZ73_01985 [Elusimicrobia bacterium]|nr:hypothetical protein [Elusimicrobiota bacterium]